MVVGEHRGDDSAESPAAGAPRLYFAAPLFSDSERVFNEQLTAEIERIGYSVFLPQRDGGELRIPDSQSLSRAERRRLVGLHTDSRSTFFHSRLNPMIGVPLDFVARTQDRLLAYLGAYYRAFVRRDRPDTQAIDRE